MELNETLKKVSEVISSSNEEVINRVVGVFVEKELSRRVDSLVSAFNSLEEKNKELAKVKPDHVLYDQDGNKTTESYTKDKVDEVKKLKESIKKVETAINAALEGDFSKVFNLPKN